MCVVRDLSSCFFDVFFCLIGRDESVGCDEDDYC